MGKPKEKRPKCNYCGRVLAWRDFQRGIAVWEVGEPNDVPMHTKDCEGVPLRVLRGRYNKRVS